MKERLDIHAFEMNGQYLVFDVQTGRIREVDAKLCEYLKAATKELDVAQIPREYRSIVAKLSRYEVEESPPIPRRITGMLLLITQACNMRCTYCYAGDGSYGAASEQSMMSQETARKAVLTLLDLSGAERLISIDFFGGEPLLNFDL